MADDPSPPESADDATGDATGAPPADYLPARMLNEFVYCPRLFYYMWVEGVFAHNHETVEGALRHQRVDSGKGALPAAEQLAAGGETIHARSITLASHTHRLIAKLDLLETDGVVVTPVDYKRGSPKKNDAGEIDVWPTDRAQLAAQALVLRDNGYTCREGVIFYVTTRQRVRVAIDDAVIRETLEAVENAWRTASSHRIPPPLEDSPKCPRCSLVTVCLPDETRLCQRLRAPANAAPPGGVSALAAPPLGTGFRLAPPAAYKPPRPPKKEPPMLDLLADETAAEVENAPPIPNDKTAAGDAPDARATSGPDDRRDAPTPGLAVKAPVANPQGNGATPSAPVRTSRVEPPADASPVDLAAESVAPERHVTESGFAESRLGAGEVDAGDDAEVAADSPVRALVPARDDLRPLYLTTQGLWVGKSGKVLVIKNKDTKVEEIRLNDVSQVNVFGNIQISTQALQTLCFEERPVALFSQGGWFYGLTEGLGLKNIFLRVAQFRASADPAFCLRLARDITRGKIHNQRVMLQRNHIEPPRRAIDLLKCYIKDAANAHSPEQLLGIEGNAARLYFENFAGMIKVNNRVANLVEPAGPADPADDVEGSRLDPGGNIFRFDFNSRNRRPPRDPVNALLSLAYSVLAKDLTITCRVVGFDPYLGFFHQPRFGRASLALDLMEPFRPLIAESAVITAINTRMVTEKDFVRAGDSVNLSPAGRKAFFRAYEQRMADLVTHPLFNYRVSYRRTLEIQTRLLARLLQGEIETYPPFMTR